jgi:hypothetical protein
MPLTAVDTTHTLPRALARTVNRPTGPSAAGHR